MAEILVCDDDKDIVEAIEIYLAQEGHHILKAYDGEQAIRVLQNNPVDLLIIDVMMPKLDGIRATLKIREKNALPIIILSAKSEDTDKILGLNVGADDYVTKPFNPLELMARVNAVLSRNSAAEKPAEKVMKFDGLEINIPARTVYVDGEKVELTPKEYDLLFYLVENKNIALSRDKLLSDIWGYDFFGDDRTIDTHIKNLRNNLGKYRDYIVTLRGVGYKFEA